MRILIIGSGGREHALAWKLKQSPQQPELFIAPGNGGTAREGTNVPIGDGDIPALMSFIKENNIDFVVPGPELPLVRGIADACAEAGVPCFGPRAYAAGLEGSKSFAKELMREAGVPTAAFAVFTDHAEAAAYVKAKGAPIVVKADGLAAGKGVVVARSVGEALTALDDAMLKRVFGEAGATVVIEDALIGEEASFLAFCSGLDVLPLPSSQDHKAAFDGDAGPNTGGMGAYSPAPVLPDERSGEIVETVIKPVLRAVLKRGCPYTGILYAGLMMTADGPRVIEFNVRFGDPECQPLLMRQKGDLLAVMQACTEGRLSAVAVESRDDTAVCVVVVGEGYPGDYEKGMPIAGLDEAEEAHPGKVKVFQAGTRLENGMPVAAGGRILGVTALGDTLAEARAYAYDAAKKIRIAKSRYRTDIGIKGLQRL